MSVAFVRRSESVPNRSNPYTSEPTSQQARVLPRGQAAVAVRTGKQTVAGLLAGAFRWSSMARRVDSVSSNLTGLPVFFWRTVALSAA